MTQILAQFANPNADLNDLIHHLEQSGQDLEIATDINPVTGEMDIVHTRSPLSRHTLFPRSSFLSTRTESASRSICRSNIGLGPDAVKETIAALHESFPDMGQPSAQRDDFMEWHVGERYVVWLKPLSADDVAQGDPDKVYTSEDVGTVKVALEIIPDSHDPEP